MLARRNRRGPPNVLVVRGGEETEELPYFGTDRGTNAPGSDRSRPSVLTPSPFARPWRSCQTSRRRSMVRAIPLFLGVLWVLFLFLGGGRGSRAAAEDAPTDRVPETSDTSAPLVVVRPLGPVPGDITRGACTALEKHYGVRCEVRSERRLDSVEAAWVASRRQLDARAVLGVLFEQRSPGAHIELGITTVDVFEPGKPYVFGLASLTDRVGIVSLARLGVDPKRRADRLAKLTLHEVGHTFGLPHHDARDCVMRQDPTIQALDTAPLRPCEHCRSQLAQRADVLMDSGELLLDRTRRLLAGGHTSRARRRLASFLAKGEFDADLLDRFALAFLEADRPNEAISVLRYLVHRWPEHAQGHAHLGLAYRKRSSQGDRESALVHFDRALQLRPRWDSVAAALEDLRQAQGPTEPEDPGEALGTPQLERLLARARDPEIHATTHDVH